MFMVFVCVREMEKEREGDLYFFKETQTVLTMAASR